jgi:hypothetical protein
LLSVFVRRQHFITKKKSGPFENLFSRLAGSGAPGRDAAMRTAARVLGKPALFVVLGLPHPRRARRRNASPTNPTGPTSSLAIYLPVHIALCEHLSDAVLYQDEQAVSFLPAKRIFQFTYYPGLSRIER